MWKNLVRNISLSTSIHKNKWGHDFFIQVVFSFVCNTCKICPRSPSQHFQYYFTVGRHCYSDIVPGRSDHFLTSSGCGKLCNMYHIENGKSQEIISFIFSAGCWWKCTENYFDLTCKRFIFSATYVTKNFGVRTCLPTKHLPFLPNQTNLWIKKKLKNKQIQGFVSQRDKRDTYHLYSCLHPYTWWVDMLYTGFCVFCQLCTIFHRLLAGSCIYTVDYAWWIAWKTQHTCKKRICFNNTDQNNWRKKFIFITSWLWWARSPILKLNLNTITVNKI